MILIRVPQVVRRWPRGGGPVSDLIVFRSMSPSLCETVVRFLHNAATVKRFYYETHDELRTHLADFVSAYNFAKRLKTLNGLTPYEFICKTWTKEPDRFNLDPLQQMPGLNI